jgi:hypothetical protein
MLGVMFGLLGLRLVGIDGPKRRRVSAAAAAAIVLLLSVAYSRSTPPTLQRIYLFNSVFREMLSRSLDPPKDLAELGLPAELARFVGYSGFEKGAPVSDPDFQRQFRRVGYATLAKFYANHPGRVVRALDRAASLAFEMRPWGLGNYTQESGRPPGAQSRRFAAWSSVKYRLAPGRLWFVAAYLLANAIVALMLRIRSRRREMRLAADIWLALVAAAAYQFVVASVMTAMSRRSFFLFNAVCDLMLIALLLKLGTDLFVRLKNRSIPV